MAVARKNILTIDIGSNAMRATIFKDCTKHYEVILQKRFPLRLGSDVFNQGYISNEKIAHMEDAFYELLTDCYKYKVSQCLAVGTSALREAKNSSTILQKIKKISGINIILIPGIKEAEIIFNAVKIVHNVKKKTVVHLDIGGGSTEIIFSHRNKIMLKKSLPLGTVRLLNADNLFSLQEKIKQTIKKNLPQSFNKYKIDSLLATGGNFKAILKAKDLIFKKSKKDEITIRELKTVSEKICQFDYYQRLKVFDLKPDRADVIVPAIFVTLQIMKYWGIKKLIAKDVGLEEGLLSYFE